MKNTEKRAILLRGINVGGANKVPMADLRALCTDLGWTDVATHIASGNLVFRSGDEYPGSRLRAAMAEIMGVDVPCPVLTAAEIRRAWDACPFPKTPGNLCHTYFLWDAASVDQALLGRLRSEEGFTTQGRLAWLHTPQGFSKSRLAEKMGKVLGTDAFTARNMNTVAKLIEMLDG